MSAAKEVVAKPPKEVAKGLVRPRLVAVALARVVSPVTFKVEEVVLPVTVKVARSELPVTPRVVAVELPSKLLPVTFNSVVTPRLVAVALAKVASPVTPKVPPIVTSLATSSAVPAPVMLSKEMEALPKVVKPVTLNVPPTVASVVTSKLPAMLAFEVTPRLEAVALAKVVSPVTFKVPPKEVLVVTLKLETVASELIRLPVKLRSTAVTDPVAETSQSTLPASFLACSMSALWEEVAWAMKTTEEAVEEAM